MLLMDFLVFVLLILFALHCVLLVQGCCCHTWFKFAPAFLSFAPLDIIVPFVRSFAMWCSYSTCFSWMLDFEVALSVLTMSFAIVWH